MYSVPNPWVQQFTYVQYILYMVYYCTEQKRFKFLIFFSFPSYWGLNSKLEHIYTRSQSRNSNFTSLFLMSKLYWNIMININEGGFVTVSRTEYLHSDTNSEHNCWKEPKPIDRSVPAITWDTQYQEPDNVSHILH